MLNESTTTIGLAVNQTIKGDNNTSTPRRHGVGGCRQKTTTCSPLNIYKSNCNNDDDNSLTFLSTTFDLSTSSLYDWRNFKDNYAQLLLMDLISSSGSNGDNSRRNGDIVEEIVDDDLQTNDIEILRDLFRENASCLFHDIVEALNCSDIAQIEIDELTRRYDEFSKRTGILAANAPNLAEEICNRSKSIRLQLNALMESAAAVQHAKRSGTTTNSCSTADAGCSSLHQLRKWLQFINEKMNSVNEQNVDWLNVGELQKVLADQQALQVEIQRDGGALLAAAKKQFSNTNNNSLSNNNRDESATTNVDDRKSRLVFQSLERRWHGLWLKSLERQCILETIIKKIELGIIGEGDYDNEWFEPVTKRRRVDDDCCSVASDTIPFSESEYESIMESSVTNMNNNSNGPDANGNFYTPLSDDYSEEDVDDYVDGSTTNVINNLNLITNYNVNYNEITTKNDDEELFLIGGGDVGYSSENSTTNYFSSSNDDESMLEDDKNGKKDDEYGEIKGKSTDDKTTTTTTIVDVKSSWSTSSSPSLERRNRIHNSPVKDYYKMTPDPDANVVDFTLDASTKTDVVSDDVRYIYTTKLPPPTTNAEMTDSLVVNVSESVENLNGALNEIVTLLDESFERRQTTTENNQQDSSTQRFHEKIDQFLKRGTSWKPFVGSKKDLFCNHEELLIVEDSCDASSELSGGDEKKVNGVVRTSTDRGTLKRRWRRPSSGFLLADIFPNSASETAIMNLSMISSTTSEQPTTSSTFSSFSKHHQQRHRQRKKLKAKRIPRSISDSEHLSVLALCVDRSPLGSWSNPRLDVVPPCTPRGSVATDSEDTELDEEDGGGEGMAEEEERMAGDGGSSVSAEPSESVWEWDDYKPPDHCEVGPLDNPLDDSKLTMFGDDYRLCLDSAPPSARSDISESVCASPNNERVPPVGFASQESDSDHDDVWRFIDESNRRLRAVRQNFGARMNFNDVGEKCALEIRFIEKFIDQLVTAGDKKKKTTSKTRNNHKRKKAFEELLKRWRCLHGELRRQQSARDEEVKMIIHKLFETLSSFMEYLTCQLTTPSRSTITAASDSSAYDYLAADIALLKEAYCKIGDERRRLNAFLKENYFVDCPEMKTCVSMCDSAAEKCGAQLKVKETVYKRLMEWKNLENAYRALIDRANDKMRVLRRRSSSKSTENNDDGKNDSTVATDVLVNLCKSIHSDIESCEDRLNRLETVCNQLCSSVGGENRSSPSLLDHFSRDLRDPLNDYRRQLEALKTQLAELSSLSQETSTIADDDENLSAVTRRLQKTTTKNCKNNNFGVGKLKKDQNSKESEKIEKKLTLKKKLSRVFRYTWPVQLCFVLAVCLGVYFLHPDCCTNVNYLNWAFGPRLDYVRGAPPS